MRPVYFHVLLFSSAALFCVSCVSTGKFKAMQQQAQQCDSLYTWSMHTLKKCQDDNDTLNKQKSALKTDFNNLDLLFTVTKDNNTQLTKQLQALSALSASQAESIKTSLDNIGAKDSYLRDLQSAVAHRDSVNLAVLLDLKATLGGFGPEDVNIKVEKGVVYVDLSDKLLFNSDSDSYIPVDQAKSVLGRLARVLNDQPAIEFIVEGHTDSISHPDSIPHPREMLPDNWDLSVKRATTIVRILQNDYNVSPGRMTAAGRGEYAPIAANDTPEGRAANRRTRIVLLPQLDPLMRVLEHKQGQVSPPAPPVPPVPPVPPASGS